MSWELDSTKEHTCPCGTGKYVVKNYSDDWGRFEEKWEMICPKCKENYVLYTYYYADSGMNCETHIWVPKEIYQELQTTVKTISEKKSSTLKRAKEKCLAAWISYFDEARTKKEVWRRLTDDGKRYPSLSAFYNHTKTIDMNEYLKKEFSYDNLKHILRTLGKEDPEINELIEEIDVLKKDEVMLKKKLISAGYKDS